MATSPTFKLTSASLFARAVNNCENPLLSEIEGVFVIVYNSSNASFLSFQLVAV